MVCVRLRYTPRERSTERAFIPSLLLFFFFFSFLSAHPVALSYSTRPVHARACRWCWCCFVCSARSAFRLLNDVALKSIGGGVFFFRGRGGGGGGPKKKGHKVFSTEHRGIKRDESQNFLGLSTSSKEGEIIQIVWPHLYIFCMDQHPPPQSKETKKETDESNDLFRVTHFPASPRGSSSVGR